MPKTPKKTARRSPGRPPGVTRDATRIRILRAARECFARTGYSATSNRQIADLAEITSAAIYQYYDSKTALFMAVVRDAEGEILSSYREAEASTTTARDGLSALIAASSAAHERDPSVTAFLSALPVEMRRHEEIARAMAEQENEVVAIVCRIVERGGLAPGVADHVVVSTFVACMMGLSLYLAAIDNGEHREMLLAFSGLVQGSLFAEAPKKASASKATKPR